MAVRISNSCYHEHQMSEDQLIQFILSICAIS